MFVYRSHCPPGLSSWCWDPLREHLSGSTTPHSLYTLCLFTGLTTHQVYLPGTGAPWEHIYLGVLPLTHSTLCVCLQVSLPTRFIFLVLGPPESTSIWEYEECGRAMAALLTDAVSISMYCTLRRGINEMFDQSRKTLLLVWVNKCEKGWSVS